MEEDVLKQNNWAKFFSFPQSHVGNNPQEGPLTELFWRRFAPRIVTASGREGRDGPFCQHRRNTLWDPWWNMRGCTFSSFFGFPLFSGETSTPERDFPRSTAGGGGGVNVREVFIFTSQTTILPGASCWLSWEAPLHLPFYWQDILASRKYTLFGVFQLLFLISF